MRRSIRFALLILALTAALPTVFATSARADTVPVATDVKIPKPLVDWLQRNGPTLYINFDEIMDDLFGCGCSPPPPPVEPPPSLP
jgi:hypothetical protein